MEAIENPGMVKRMFTQGEVTMVDPESKYRYSLVTKCPKDGDYSFVERYERFGHSLSRVIFKCGRCSNQFEARVADILVV